jgi:SAM-dependent methyltransferase
VHPYAIRSARQLGLALDLALISFVALYFEMIAIRWLASDVRVFAYLKNLPLLAAFLGLGLGCARAGTGRAIWWFPPLCLVFAAIVAAAEPLGLVHLYFPQDDVWAWNDANWQQQQLPAALLAARFFAVVLGLFFLVVALFAALGARLGALFDALPPTRAYAVNLAASLAGIWVFAALSWFGWPPAGWFALGLLAVARFFISGLNPPGPGDAWSIPRRTLQWMRGTGSATVSSARRPPVPLWGKGGGGEVVSPSGRIAHAPAAFSLACLVATLAVVALAPGATRWSPYYRIDLSPYTMPGPAGGLDTAGYKMTVNHDYHQNALNLGDAYLRTHPGLEAARTAYDLPYRFAEPRHVLVVGAGMGNDVAAALRHGAQRVDAVEIDPAILALGREVHPERPYGSPRVRAIADDARAYLARTDEQYDLIVFGLLDSHTLLSSLSSLRLDSYVYTAESLRQARSRLTPDGHLVLTFAASVGNWDWLAARLFQMIAGAFESEPVAVRVSYDMSTLFVVGPNASARLAADPALAALAIDPTPLRVPVAPATDDWPFLYLRDHSVPLLPYGVVLGLLLSLGGGLVILALRGPRGPSPAPPGGAAASIASSRHETAHRLRTPPPAPALSPLASAATPARGLDLPMFLLGAAFMLLETKSISQLSLLFGSTWLVNAVIITAILVLALAANLYVGWRRPARVGPAYALLGLALVLEQLLSLSALGGLPLLLRAVVGGLLLALPLLFAGVVFATLFARAASPSQAFGSNLLGALAGGLLEYVSMITGFKALGLIALALYAASWLALRRRPLLTQAHRGRAWRRPRAPRPVPR